MPGATLANRSIDTRAPAARPPAGGPDPNLDFGAFEAPPEAPRQANTVAGARVDKKAATVSGLDFGPAAPLPPGLEFLPDEPAPIDSSIFSDRWSDSDSEARKSAAIYYPCRQCELLYTAAEVYAEADGEVICRACFTGKGGKPNTEVALPAGLEAVPTLAPTENREIEGLFCEMCSKTFPPNKLQMVPTGEILCRLCIRKKARKQKDDKRQAEQLSRIGSGGKMPRKKDDSQLVKTIVTLICALGAIGFLCWNLGLFEPAKVKKLPKKPTPAVAPEHH